MKVLIMGGAGYIGSVLTRTLLNQGHEVRVLDVYLFNQDSLEGIDNSKLEVIRGDIRSIGTITDAVQGMDAVILLAALVGEPACDVDPQITSDVNWIATKAVAEACKYHGIQRFIFASTDSIYGIREGIMKEDSEKNPISLYARLKLRAEEEILQMGNDDFHPTVLRMSTIYGLSPRMRFDLVVNVLSMKATLDGAIKIFGGKQWRPFVHVADAAKAYALVLKQPLSRVSGEIFNVGSNEQNYQVGDLGVMVQEVFPHVKVETISQTPDLRDYNVNCDKIHDMLGYSTEKSVTDAIIEIRDAILTGSIADPSAKLFYNV